MKTEGTQPGITRAWFLTGSRQICPTQSQFWPEKLHASPHPYFPKAMAMMMGNAARIARIKAVTLTILKAEQRREEKDHAIKHRPDGRV
jgi:hypothetical protein